MPKGKISQDNDKVVATIPKELKEQFAIVAENEHYSMSSLLRRLIAEYVDLSKNKSKMIEYRKLILEVNMLQEQEDDGE